MKLSDVLPFFRSQLNALQYKEWTDSFNFENIPSTILDRRYHLELNDALGVRNNQLDQECNAPVTIRIFFKAFRDTSAARDLAIKKGQEIIETVLKPEVRVTDYADGIKNIVFDSMLIEDAIVSNDNITVLTLGFTALVFLQT